MVTSLRYSTASAEPSFEHPSPRFTLTCSLKMTTAIGIFLTIFRVVTSVQLPTAVYTARRGVRTPRVPMAGHGGPWWLIAYFIQFTCTLCRRWKAVDRADPSRATTANPRVRSSRNARVMTTRVNGCSAAAFDRAWIILTTGVRGFMKVPRWLYCIITSILDRRITPYLGGFVLPQI